MQTITIGCQTFTKAQAIEIMKQSTSTDMSYQMAAHLIAAKLNIGCAGSNSSCVASAITAGDNWMCNGHPVGSKVKASSSDWQSISSTFNTLVKYNEGKACAPARK